jgi:hypothetical protein
VHVQDQEAIPPVSDHARQREQPGSDPAREVRLGIKKVLSCEQEGAFYGQEGASWNQEGACSRLRAVFSGTQSG